MKNSGGRGSPEPHSCIFHDSQRLGGSDLRLASALSPDGLADDLWRVSQCLPRHSQVEAQLRNRKTDRHRMTVDGGLAATISKRSQVNNWGGEGGIRSWSR